MRTGNDDDARLEAESGRVEEEAIEEAVEYEEEEKEHAEHKHLQLAIALSIALVSVIGALVSWRAELRAGAASSYDQNAVAATLAATNETARSRTQAATAESNWERYTRLGQEAARLDPQACGTTSDSSVAQAEAEVACNVQVVFSGYNDPHYVSKGLFNTSAYTADVVAADRYGIDADPAPYQKKAAHERQMENYLLYVSVLLVLALALLTVGRLARTRRRILALCVPGWVCLVAGGALVAAMEF